MSHRPIEYQGEDSVGRIERRRPVTHLSPGEEGQTLRLFDGATYAFRSRGEGYALLESTAPPGGGMPPHTHHTQDEVIYVLEGEFSFASKDGALTLGPGCLVCVPRGTVHALKVSGESRAGACCYSPRPDPWSGSSRRSGRPLPRERRSQETARIHGWKQTRRRCWRAHGETGSSCWSRRYEKQRRDEAVPGTTRIRK